MDNTEEKNYGAYIDYCFGKDLFFDEEDFENPSDEDLFFQEPTLFIWINEDSRNDNFKNPFGEKFAPCYEDCQDFNTLSDDQKVDLWKMILSYKEELKKAVDNFSCTTLEQRKSRLYY